MVVQPGSYWRWLWPQRTNDIDPAKADPDFHRTFFTAEFDDNAWQIGTDRDDATGGFGYGEDWFTGVDIGTPQGEPTQDGLPPGKTAYFRHPFTTTKTHTNLELRCPRDDGIIAYLDGLEAARDNMQVGDEAYDLSALSPVGDEMEPTVFRLPLSDLVLPPGNHLLAISLHNPAEPSSDLRIGGISLVEVVPNDNGEENLAD